MKNLIPTGCLSKLMGLLCTLPLGLTAAELNATISAPLPTSSPQVAVGANVNTTVRLPYAMAEVVKLTRAQVSEDVILSYVQNSSSTYALNSDDIVRLRNEGVSDRVVNAILDKNNRTIQAFPANNPPAPVYADNSDSVSGPPQQPVEAPLTPSVSSTYVIPYPAVRSAYYGYYAPSYYAPYYPGYYGFYGAPALSFRFGFGGVYGGFRGGHGGFHGGHGGGGFHGGHGHR